MGPFDEGFRLGIGQVAPAGDSDLIVALPRAISWSSKKVSAMRLTQGTGVDGGFLTVEGYTTAVARLRNALARRV